MNSQFLSTLQNEDISEFYFSVVSGELPQKIYKADLLNISDAQSALKAIQSSVDGGAVIRKEYIWH